MWKYFLTRVVIKLKVFNSCRSCRTGVVLVLLFSHLCPTGVVHFTRSCLALVLWNRLDHKFVYFHCTCNAKCRCQLRYLEINLDLRQWFKGTLMQIWKSTNISVFILKEYVEDFKLKHFLLFEICAREICEMFVYRHSETIDYVKN